MRNPWKELQEYYEGSIWSHWEGWVIVFVIILVWSLQ